MAIKHIWKKDILAYCGIDDAEVLIHYSARISGMKEKTSSQKGLLVG